MKQDFIRLYQEKEKWKFFTYGKKFELAASLLFPIITFTYEFFTQEDQIACCDYSLNQTPKIKISRGNEDYCQKEQITDHIPIPLGFCVYYCNDQQFSFRYIGVI